jgi:hypothetical protein
MRWRWVPPPSARALRAAAPRAPNRLARALLPPTYHPSRARCTPTHAARRTRQVVLVSQCKTLADFNGYFAGMQWAAVPYTFEGREGIFTQNDVHGLPQALVLRVSDGSVVLKDCRELVNTKKTLVGIFQ